MEVVCTGCPGEDLYAQGVCVCVEEEGGDKYSLCNNVLEEFGLNDSAYHYFLFCLKHIQSEKLDNRDSSLLLFLL